MNWLRRRWRRMLNQATSEANRALEEQREQRRAEELRRARQAAEQRKIQDPVRYWTPD